MRVKVGLLAEYDFRQLLAADTISQLGSRVSVLALPLVAVLALHASTLEVGLLTASTTLAFLVVGLPAGALMDRTLRRAVLISADVGRALILGSVPLAWALRVLTMPQLYLVAISTGILNVFFDVAHQSYLPSLIHREHLIEGNSKLQAVASVGVIAGPALGGFAIQLLTAPIAVAIDAVSFLGSAWFISRIRKREDPLDARRSAKLTNDVIEGVRFVFADRLFRAIAMSTAVACVFNGVRAPILILLLSRQLHLSGGIIGAFFSVVSVGALVGALVANRVARRIGSGRAIVLSLLITTPFQLLVPFARHGWLLWAAAVANAIVWLGAGVYDVSQISFRQEATPERLLGRMNATYRFLTWGPIPLGGVLGGVLGQVFGIRTALWIAAVGGLLPCLPLMFSPLRGMRDLPKPVQRGEADEPLAATI